MAQDLDMLEAVVWEWFTDHGRWRPYQAHIVRGIEENYGKTVMLRLGDIEPSMGMYEIDFSTQQQIRNNTGMVRSIRRRTFSSTSAPAQDIEWQWQDDHGWCPYDVDTSVVIEEAYKHPYGSIDLSVSASCLPYELDLVAMTQKRLGTGFLRSIRRVVLPAPGYPKFASAPIGKSASMNSLSVEMESPDGGSPSLSRPTSLQPASQSSTAPPVDDSNSSQGSDCSATASSSMGRSSKKNAGKRTTSRKSVAATSGVRATVAWSSPPDPNAAGTSTGSSNTGLRSLPRSVSVPTTMAGVSNTAIQRPSITSGAVMSSSSTTSCLAAAAAASRMTRSQSTPNSITARPAHAAGARLSPVMTAITGLLLSTAVPVMIHPTPIPIFSPPPTSRGSIRPVEGIKPNKKKRKTTLVRVDSADDVMKNYVTKVKKSPDEECPICYEKLTEGSHYTDNSDDMVLKLNKCGHLFHRGCLHAMYGSGPKDGSIQCPTCKTIYGVKHGNQPPGRMDYHIIPHSLQGFPECCAIRIIYDIPPGTQGADHPNPGKRYSARGFPRHCYLPDNEIGRKILRLLIVAWERRLLFTIATSATTGESSTVVWNEIHHKTEFGSNVTGHGFPDPNYFDNVLSELAAQGVTEDCIKE